MAESSAPIPAWWAKGLFFENCNCQVVCPGHVHFSNKCTYERCIGYWAIRFDEGSYGDVDLAGVTAVIGYGFSRFLLECRGLYSTSIELAKPVFIKVFREFGVPAVIRSDNGTPFASIGLARLTRLSAWWIRLGIRPETIEPGKPQQNGRHERMHRTLKREATRPPKANLRAQQRHFNHFRRTFNSIRPHEALDDATPDSVYRSALRAYPDVLPPIEYPEHFEVRKVSTNGGIRWHSRWTGQRVHRARTHRSRSVANLLVLLPSGGLTKNSSSFSTPTATQDVTPLTISWHHCVNHHCSRRPLLEQMYV